ncbi:MAG: hypothetical protein ACE5J7_00730 [Candidatus Aenigmatarchaeota archaeon]
MIEFEVDTCGNKLENHYMKAKRKSYGVFEVKYNLKVIKSGSKIGMYMPFVTDELKGKIAEVTIRKTKKKSTFLAKLNQFVTIRKATEGKMLFKLGDTLEVKIKVIQDAERPSKIFPDGKVDMLSLIPKRTSNGYRIFVTEFRKADERWLRMWYCHQRGSGRQIEIRRYVNIETLGKLFGQYQAEGTKDAKLKLRFEFCNKSIEEHQDFISYLMKIGIPKNKIFCSCSFHPSIKDIKKHLQNFEGRMGLKVSYLHPSPESKRSYGFRTFVRNRVIIDTLLSALDRIRKLLVREQWDTDVRLFADSFFSKLLTGDGTLDIHTKNREYGYPYARIKIVDRQLEYLKDYAVIMRKLGFKPHIIEKRIFVVSGCTLSNLLYLHKIRAFENTNNWEKLVLCIGMYMDGRRHKTNYRFLDLVKLDSFTSFDLMKKYNLQLRTVNDWLNNKEKEGLLIGTRKRPYAVRWKVTNKAKIFAEILSKWKREFNEFLKLKKATNLIDLLDSLKTKGRRLSE